MNGCYWNATSNFNTDCVRRVCGKRVSVGKNHEFVEGDSTGTGHECGWTGMGIGKGQVLSIAGRNYMDPTVDRSLENFCHLTGL
jgi:hypothetical protein